MGEHDPKFEASRDLSTDGPNPIRDLLTKGDPVRDMPTTHHVVSDGSAAEGTVDGFELLGEIGRGGMGVVYLATDEELGREVAVKVLARGLRGNPAVEARFVEEARITAGLQHPGIPPVYRVGWLSDGRPFLAMKLIRGRTLSALLKEKGHGSAKWLPAFEGICQAVGYAHAAGYIHRDLKPGNVMVGAFGEVQVMDWGLAKRLAPLSPGGREVGGEGAGSANATGSTSPAAADPSEADLTRPNLFAPTAPPRDGTRAGAVMGSPPYMAPEQARGEIDAVDRRADVFSLGCILCQLLTGATPLSGEARDIISAAAGGHFPEAFARLDGCGEDAALVGLAKRCLSGDRADRPTDATAVADAVAAYRGEADARAKRAEVAKAEATVQAAEGRKRQRVLAWAGGVVAAVLLVGLLGTAIGLLEAKRQEGHAKEQEATANQNAETARQNAETARQNEQTAIREKEAKDVALKAESAAKAEVVKKQQEAERNLGFARENYAILGAVFTDLDPEGQAQSLGELRTALRENLQKAARKLEQSTIDDPLVIAEVQNTLGQSLLGLGEPQLAIGVLEKARDARRRKLGPTHPDTLASTNNLALGYRFSGLQVQAVPLLKEVHDQYATQFEPDDPRLIRVKHNLAGAYRAVGQPMLALPLMQDVFKRTKAILGLNHLETFRTQNALGACYHDTGDLAKSRAVLEDLVERAKRVAPDHGQTLLGMHNLAMTLMDLGESEPALELFRETLKRRREKLGLDHPQTLESLAALGDACMLTGKRAEALPLLEQALEIRTAKFGPDHPRTLDSMRSLGGYHYRGKEYEKAERLFEKSLQLDEEKNGKDNPGALEALNNLGYLYLETKRPEKAVPLFERAYKICKASHGADHLLTFRFTQNLCDALHACKRGEETVPYYKAYAEAVRKKCPPDFPGFAGLNAELARDLIGWGQFSAAEEMLRESLAIWEKKPDVWDASVTRCLLGAALLGQKKYEDAEPFLVRGYEGLKLHEKSIPLQFAKRIPESLDRLIELSTATDKPDEVKKYKELRAKYPATKEKK